MTFYFTVLNKFIRLPPKVRVKPQLLYFYVSVNLSIKTRIQFVFCLLNINIQVFKIFLQNFDRCFTSCKCFGWFWFAWKKPTCLQTFANYLQNDSETENGHLQS